LAVVLLRARAEFGRTMGKLVKQRYMLSVMCGLSAYKLRQE
jgi:hypothetical protein